MQTDDTKAKIVGGNIVLTDPNCAFVWTSSTERVSVKVIDKDTIRLGECFVLCDSCQAEPAIQLDGHYKEKVHTFTLCVKCLDYLTKF